MSAPAHAASSMQAVYLTGHGGNEVVCVGPRPRPEPAAGEVRVRLHAATLNRVDLYMRESGAGITHTLPQTMGIDGAGVVAERLARPGCRDPQWVLEVSPPESEPLPAWADDLDAVDATDDPAWSHRAIADAGGPPTLRR